MKKMKAMIALALTAAMLLTACGGQGIEKSEAASAPAASSAEASTDAAAPAESTAESTEAAESEAPAAADSQMLVIGQSMTYTTLDPANCYESESEMILHNTYNTLLVPEVGDDANLLPSAATDWTISDDGLTYVFNIKQGVKFTTGKEMKAEDVAYCLNRLKGIKGNPSFLLDTMESAEATGDYELTLKLNQVNPAILNILSRGFFGIYDSEVAKANGGTCDENDTFQAWADANPSIGSGAYQVTSYTSGSEVVMDKFADASLIVGNIDRVIVRNIDDAGTQQMELEAGDLDIAMNLTADQTDLMTDTEGIQLINSASFDIFFFMMNASEEYGKEFANPKVREAIRYALDYDGLCLLAGNGAKTPMSIIPDGFFGYAGDATITRDVDKAKELLTEAGYPDGFEFTCGVIPDMAPDGVSFMTCAEKIATDLSEIGVNMKIDSQEVSVYLQGYRDGTEQAVVGQWGPDYFDSLNQLAFLPGEMVGLRAGWTAEMAPELSELGKQASTETDDDARKALIEQIQVEMEAQASPFIVYLQPGRVLAVSDSLENVIPSSGYMLDFSVISFK